MGTTRSPKSQTWDLLGLYRVAKNGRAFITRLRFIQTPWFAVYLSRIHGPDTDRAPHDHSRTFASWKLIGRYDELVFSDPADLTRMRVRRHRWLGWHVTPMSSAHQITWVSKYTVTFMIAGRRRPEGWSFWTPDGLVPYEEYDG